MDEAREEGAEVIQPSTPLPEEGYWFPPTIITNVQPTSRCVVDEVRERTAHHRSNAVVTLCACACDV